MGRLRKERKPCPICNVTVEDLRSVYCSNTCQQEYRHQAYIESWLRGEKTGNQCTGRNLRVSHHVRRYLIEKYGEKCTRCGWDEKHPITNKVPITVDHIDGDPFRSTEDNLTLLCPNCHSLTSTSTVRVWTNVRRIAQFLGKELAPATPTVRVFQNTDE